MTSSISDSPTSARAFAATRVPIADAGESVGEVRDRLVGGERLESPSEVAVIEAGRLIGVFRSRIFWQPRTRCRSHCSYVAHGYYNIELMLGSLLRLGGEVGVCGTSMDSRGISEAELAAGCHRGTGASVYDFHLGCIRVSTPETPGEGQLLGWVSLARWRVRLSGHKSDHTGSVAIPA